MSARMLSSNGIALPDDARHVGRLTDSCADDLGTGRARQRLLEDGYVLLRDALPRARVLDIRQAYLSLFGQAGAVRDLPAYGVARHPAHDFVRGTAFKRFAEEPVFRDIAQILLGGPVERINRTPLRHFLPGQKAASRAHIDGTYIAGTPQDIVTLWVPLGDCPVEAGGLIYLEGSHQGGLLDDGARQAAPIDRPGDRRPITHDLKWMAEQTARRWLVTDYRAGDVIVHTPLIVHASLDSVSDQPRISTDIRFIRAGVPHDPRWLDDWSADDGY